MKFVTILLFAVGVLSKHDNWSYKGDSGPEHWPDINMGGTNECGMRRQSPIDIDILKARFDSSLRPLVITGHDKVNSEISLVNNGHSVQLNSAQWRQTLTGGPLTGDYKLLQAHFHWGKDSYRGSEHTISGRRYPIELHLVHAQANITNGRTDYPGAISVIAVFFDVTKGKGNVGIQKITNALADLNNGATDAKPTELSTSMLLPSTKAYFTYEGSLTTPPCSQVVTWIVLQEPLKITEDQLNIFRSALFPDKSPMVDNFRPVQPLNNREVRASFHVFGSSSMTGSSLLLTVLSYIITRFM